MTHGAAVRAELRAVGAVVAAKQIGSHVVAGSGERVSCLVRGPAGVPAGDAGLTRKKSCRGHGGGHEENSKSASEHFFEVKESWYC